MRVVSWNILHGGGRRLSKICTAIQHWSPDIVTLQEVRSSSTEQLVDMLDRCGLSHRFIPDTASKSENTLLLASRESLVAGDFIDQRSGQCHILEAETMGLTLLPVHFPQKSAQVPLFKTVLDDSPSLLLRKCMLIGDLNCGIPFQDSTDKTFVNTRYFQAMKEAGWVDLYRQHQGDDARDFTWISPRTQKGFRYDHALCSGNLSELLVDIQYDHSVREEGLSDHSALILELDLSR